MSLFKRTEPITDQRAQEAAFRLINSHFNNNRTTHPHARCTIPCNIDDDDVVIVDYIRQQSELRAQLEAAQRTWQRHCISLEQVREVAFESEDHRIEHTVNCACDRAKTALDELGAALSAGPAKEGQ